MGWRESTRVLQIGGGKITRIRVLDRSQAGTVAPNGSDDICIKPDNDVVWRVLALRVSVGSVSNASGGYHEIALRGEGQNAQPEYFKYSNSFNNGIEIHRSTAHGNGRPGNPTTLCGLVGRAMADSNEGVELCYWNNTAVSQNRPRTIQLRVLEESA